MNKIILSFFFIAAGLLVSCSDYVDKVEPGPPVPANCQGVFFPTTNKAVVEMEPTEPTELMITIARMDTTNAVDVPITVTVNDDNVFVVPKTVSFAKMQKTTQFKVTFPKAGEGVAYKLTLAVQGDEFVNPYNAGAPFVNTSVTRIKWSLTSEPFIFVEPVGSWGYNIPSFAMYVETYKAVVGSSTRYRLKNAYRITNDGPDADGIFDGYPADYLAASPYTDDFYFDDSEARYITLEIDNNGNVYMEPSKTGFYFDSHVDGMVTLGSIYKNLNDDISKYPLGTLDGDIITFPDNSLFVGLDILGKSYILQSTKIYLTKEAYLADNMKIRDFNDVEYEEIPGAVSEFESKAYGGGWNQILSKAIDIDETNPDSEYKNLYFLPDLYANNFGVAFYYDGKTVKIPAAQPIGKKFMNQNIYVSQSTTVQSSVTTTTKGVTVYTLGLKFHYKDGTVLGEFAETYYYSKDPISYSIDDFCGNYTMTGTSFFGLPPANRAVSITKGMSANSLTIKGILYAASISATFDPVSVSMNIAPQQLADYEEDGAVYYMELDTYAKAPSGTAVLTFTKNLKDQIVLKPTSAAIGYLIYGENYDDEADAGWFDGYYNLVFTPRAASSSISMKSSVAYPHPIVKTSTKELNNVSIIEREKCSNGNFSIQSKASLKKALKHINAVPIF